MALPECLVKCCSAPKLTAENVTTVTRAATVGRRHLMGEEEPLHDPYYMKAKEDGGIPDDEITGTGFDPSAYGNKKEEEKKKEKSSSPCEAPETCADLKLSVKATCVDACSANGKAALDRMWAAMSCSPASVKDHLAAQLQPETTSAPASPAADEGKAAKVSSVEAAEESGAAPALLDVFYLALTVAVAAVAL